jgi:type II restriction/modification system DNA methylase subunit YeeA
LERIKKTGDIFWAQSDREWILDGAAVHVSMIGFDDGSEKVRELDGTAVDAINANLTSSVDLTKAARLTENLGLSYMGDTKGGDFDLEPVAAQSMLQAPLNPNGRPNADVLVLWVNGSDITGRSRGYYIIDFGVDMAEQNAALYEMPFRHVVEKIKPKRDANRRESYRKRWWIHVEPRPEMRTKLKSLKRYLATPAVSKFRLFTWLDQAILPDHALFVFVRDDDYFFGILHSHVHELWARAQGTQVREAESGFRYTPTSTFETFPFPWPPGKEPAIDLRVQAIAAAAKGLVEKRDAWLNPPGASAAELKKRTLTNLYNQRPQWLEDAHRALDKAVLAAYGWPDDLSDTDVLERLLALNRERAGA